MKLGLFGASCSARSWLARALLAAQPALHVNEDINVHVVEVCDLALLMGLDSRSNDAAMELEDLQLRARLADSGQAFHVLYGSREACLQTAQLLLNLHNATTLIANNVDYLTASGTISSKSREPWHWNCDTCGDPDCERQLFSGLVKSCGPGLQSG